MQDNSNENSIYSLKKKPTVFKDENTLSLIYVPSSLPGREEELKKLINLFKNIFSEDVSPLRLITISGPTGSGKTVLAKRFGQQLENQYKLRDFLFIYINCRVYKSPFLIMSTLVRRLDKTILLRGYSSKELIHLLVRLLELHKLKILLVIDEIDYLISRRGIDLVYSLLKINKMTKNQWISYIFIERNLKFIEHFNNKTKKKFLSNHISLNHYSKNELRDIINSRAEIAIRSYCFSSEIAEVIADLTSKSGKASFAIEILWGAGRCADYYNMSPIKPHHVREAKGLILAETEEEKLLAFTLHHNLILLGIIRELKRRDTDYIIDSEIFELYKSICEEFNVSSEYAETIWESVFELSNRDLITTKIEEDIETGGKERLISLFKPEIEELESLIIEIIERKKKFSINHETL